MGHGKLCVQCKFSESWLLLYGLRVIQYGFALTLSALYHQCLYLVGVRLHLFSSYSHVLVNTTRMSAESPPRYIYKIVPSPPGDPFPKEHPLSELDQTDGFVHLSTSTQVSVLRIRCHSLLMQLRYLRPPTYSLLDHPHFGSSNSNSGNLLISSGGRAVFPICMVTSGRKMSTPL
jgi:hypothetical protein